MNWLNTSTGHSAAYKFTTGGANDNIALWESGDQGFDSANPFRNSEAYYFLPSLDEWYKAAYYDPGANGGTGGNWSNNSNNLQSSNRNNNSPTNENNNIGFRVIRWRRRKGWRGLAVADQRASFVGPLEDRAFEVHGFGMPGPDSSAGQFGRAVADRAIDDDRAGAVDFILSRVSSRSRPGS